MDVHPRAWYLLRKKKHSVPSYAWTLILRVCLRRSARDRRMKRKRDEAKGRKTAWNNNGARLSSDDRARDGFLCKWTSPTILESHLNAPAQLQHMRAHNHGEHGHLRGNSCNWRTISPDARHSL